MSDEIFDYLLRTTPPDELKRQWKQAQRGMGWLLWRDKHPKWAGFIDGACWAAMALLPRGIH